MGRAFGHTCATSLVFAAIAIICVGFAAGNSRVGSCFEGNCVADVEAEESTLMQVRQATRRESWKPHKWWKPNRPVKCSGLADSPSKYRDCWSKKKVCCVSDKLLGSVISPGATKAYPEKRKFAWFGGKEDLENALRLRHKFGDKEPAQITIGIQVAVGFNPLFDTWAAKDAPPSAPGFQWLVIERPEGKKIPIDSPTWGFFFDYYNSEDTKSKIAGVGIDYDVAKEILLTYANLENNGHPYDVVQAWHKLTGCSRECSVPVKGDIIISRKCGCHKEVVKAWEVVGPYASDPSKNSSRVCLKDLYKKFPKPTAGQLRVAFYACNDNLPIYTGFGLGYNTIVSSLQCDGNMACSVPVDRRYGGREYVMPNLPIDVFDPDKKRAVIDLAPIPKKDINRVTNTFCG